MGKKGGDEEKNKVFLGPKNFWEFFKRFFKVFFEGRSKEFLGLELVDGEKGLWKQLDHSGPLEKSYKRDFTLRCFLILSSSS